MTDVKDAEWPKLAELSIIHPISASILPKYLQEASNAVSRRGDTSKQQINLEELSVIQYASTETKLFQLLLQREWLTAKLAKHGKCYPPLILDRAHVYEALQYHDLAAFDAYTVYVLCQKELTEEFVTDLVAHDMDGGPWLHSLTEEQFRHHLRELKADSLATLARCIRTLGGSQSMSRFEAELRDDTNFSCCSDEAREGPSWKNLLHPELGEADYELQNSVTPSKFGASRREIYPWSTHEPARNAPESIAEVNEYLSSVSSDLEAKVTALPGFDAQGNATDQVSYQLGLFARRTLEPGKEVLSETSILTAIRPLEDAICDACGEELEGIPFEDIRQCDGEDCDTTFCSEECKQRAAAEYHRPRLEEGEEDKTGEGEQASSGDENDHCSTKSNGDEQDITATSTPFCGNTDLSTIGRPTNTETPEWDLYFLLLTRTIAMSLSQNKHPLQLKETKFLWGDFNCTPFTFPDPALPLSSAYPRTLPFSVQHNLEYVLDYFTTLSLSDPRATPYSAYWLEHFDFWILQTLFAKFRGVANASQSTFDGKPEIASVHPIWCLANHSCDPNVRWTPKGTRKFFVRTKDERANVGGREKGIWKGIRAGEEIFSHYTDIRLPVQDRRERLSEVLGGACQCDRCRVESGEQ